MGIVLSSLRTWKCAAEYNMERPLSRILNVCCGLRIQLIDATDCRYRSAGVS